MRGTREFYDEIPSTQDRALELARAGSEEGTRVVARRQTSGRGRLDHRWESPPGGLYLSLVLASPAEHAGLLPLALGAELADRLAARCGLSLGLKWPNDVLVLDGRVPSRKLAGILIDRIPSPRLGTAAVAGVGVNVATDLRALSPEVAARVAVLRDLCPDPPDLDAVEELVVRAALDAARATRTPDGVEEVRARCRRALWGVGRRATVDGRPAGRIVGLGDEGELWVENAGERMPIRTGDLRVEETA